MPKIFLLNKPFGVVSQFSGNIRAETLASLIDQKGYYPAGRLDKDSEGLLILTNDGRLQSQITNPRFKLGKTYLAQVENEISPEAIALLQHGILLNDGLTKPAIINRVCDPTNIWSRIPPIRERKSITTSWIRITIYEGRNRQIRRMTAAVGFPTLRLIRMAIGEWRLENLLPGQSIQKEVDYI
tara:strand:- start:1455 stop:2006 length:552 start_codon:yes stop_codon:yes gene_type:complete